MGRRRGGLLEFHRAKFQVCMVGMMFNKLFGGPKSVDRLQAQPTTRVLLLPITFLGNSALSQTFTIAERRKLIEIFEEAGADYELFGTDDEPIFDAQPINMSDEFFADTNDLNNVPGPVRDFEFFSRHM